MRQEKRGKERKMRLRKKEPATAGTVTGCESKLCVGSDSSSRFARSGRKGNTAGSWVDRVHVSHGVSDVWGVKR